jgi:hypothetical protein
VITGSEVARLPAIQSGQEVDFEMSNALGIHQHYLESVPKGYSYHMDTSRSKEFDPIPLLPFPDNA